ncbi:MAG TPA: ABC transporter permease [Ktedonobacterales bacterium]|nr:ABC transporter permease [Ktedonobacterales bacterium]
MTTTTQAQLDIQRVAPIVRGRTDYLSVLLRLIGMDLYKVRRRRLSKMLLLVGTLVVALVFLGLGIAGWYYASKPLSSFVPPQCVAHETIAGCINHPATQADEQQYKQYMLSYPAERLNMPGVWNLEGQLVFDLLAALGIILAGALVGNEYSLGTVRLMFTRGPTRLQFLIAKIAVLAIYVVPTILFLMLVGTVIGAVMGPLTGIGPDYRFLTVPWFGHFVLYLLLGMLYWFAYMLMALFFGTVGRSTVAGTVGPLIWLAAEPALSGIIAAFTNGANGGLAAVVKAIPDYFLSNNLLSLLSNQGHALSFSDPGPYSDMHSLLVIAAYLIVFVGVACWLTVRRDVTH